LGIHCIALPEWAEAKMLYFKKTQFRCQKSSHRFPKDMTRSLTKSKNAFAQRSSGLRRSQLRTGFSLLVNWQGHYRSAEVANGVPHRMPGIRQLLEQLA